VLWAHRQCRLDHGVKIARHLSQLPPHADRAAESGSSDAAVNS
jgi:hypothetical protein